MYVGFFDDLQIKIDDRTIKQYPSYQKFGRKASFMSNNLKQLTAAIVASYLDSNNVPAADLPSIINSTFDALSKLGKPVQEVQTAKLSPAVPIKKSITPDAVICLECGAKGAMLKRHLQAAHDMMPDQYRARWGLSQDYLLVAPNYAARRSELAKAVGLGQKRRS